MAYRDLPWEIPDATLGRFDLIIGSDMLYERGHSELLAAIMLRHASEHTEILITDPGRGNSARFSKAMALQGFGVDEQTDPLRRGGSAAVPRQAAQLPARASTRINPAASTLEGLPRPSRIPAWTT